MFKKNQGPAQTRPAPAKGDFNVREFVLEIAKVVIISLAVVIPVRYFLIQPFYVKGASMEPNFYDHEYLVVDEISYRFQDPQRGDIIVFRYPYDPQQYFIKRIIGLPGEEIKIENGEITIVSDAFPEGTRLDEGNYLSAGTRTSGQTDVTLTAGQYFVMGDNRTHSLDSRSFGPVPRQNIIGRTWIRGWPPDRITLFESPEYDLQD